MKVYKHQQKVDVCILSYYEVIYLKELKYNLKYIINKKELYLSIIGILCVNLIHIFLVIHYSYNAHAFYENWYKAEYLTILYNVNVLLNMVIIIAFPIISSTIFSDTSWLENKSKMNTILYTRLNYKKLIVTRLFLILFIVFFINFIGFLMNYIVLNCIYGSGNAMTYMQSPAFNLTSNQSYFLDSLRLSNPILFIICISAHVSLIIGLLSSFAYAISFFVKQRVMIYISSFVLIIGTELLLSFLKLNQYSIVKQLQPFSRFSFKNAITLYFAFIIFSFFLLLLHFKKRDVL